MNDRLPPFHGYQDDAVDFALARQGSNLFARPGKGKTRIALETIESTGKRTLVVCPLFPALTVWRQEAAKWGYNFNMRLMHGKEKKPGNEDVSIINYEGLLWLREQKKLLSTYEYIIYDEVSKMKDPGSRRFKKWRKVMPDFSYRLGLTGTPLGNRLLDLWGETYCVECQASPLGRTMHGYQREYFYPHPYIRNTWVPKPDVRDTIFELIKPNALALDYGDAEMPPLYHNRIDVPMPAAARKAYDEMKKASIVDGTDVVAVNAGVRSQKLRQIAAGAVYDNEGVVVKMHDAKKTALRNLIDELGGDPALIFFEFRHDLAAIREVIGQDVPALHGDTKPEDMVAIVAAWNRGEIPALPAHPKTAGMGGNMQESGNTVIWYTVPWSLESVEQGIDRVWRQGQKRHVTAHYLLVPDTKDCEVFDAVNTKQEEQDALFTALAR